MVVAECKPRVQVWVVGSTWPYAGCMSHPPECVCVGCVPSSIRGQPQPPRAAPTSADQEQVLAAMFKKFFQRRRHCSAYGMGVRAGVSRRLGGCAAGGRGEAQTASSGGCRPAPSSWLAMAASLGGAGLPAWSPWCGSLPRSWPTPWCHAGPLAPAADCPPVGAGRGGAGAGRRVRWVQEAHEAGKASRQPPAAPTRLSQAGAPAQAGGALHCMQTVLPPPAAAAPCSHASHAGRTCWLQASVAGMVPATPAPVPHTRECKAGGCALALALPCLVPEGALAGCGTLHGCLRQEGQQSQ